MSDKSDFLSLCLCSLQSILVICLEFPSLSMWAILTPRRKLISRLDKGWKNSIWERSQQTKTTNCDDSMYRFPSRQHIVKILQKETLTSLILEFIAEYRKMHHLIMKRLVLPSVWTYFPGAILTALFSCITVNIVTWFKAKLCNFWKKI